MKAPRKLPRPYTILIAALGGEGGGVLADWLVDAASREGYPVQSTSIPGVSQRTGATTYYVEIFPVPERELGGKRPVMALVPCAGAIDLMAATELVEAGRAMQNAFVTPQRTTLIAATHRIYATSEKMVALDGRYDSGNIVAAADHQARRAILLDMAQLAREAGTVINAVLFGAMCGSGELPLSRAACEEAIRGAGKGAEASLRGFALGFAQAASTAPVKAREVPPVAADASPRVHLHFPIALHATLDLAYSRVVEYQDAAYGELYLDRVNALFAADRVGANDAYALTREAARLLALWMCYEDVIRVAELKTRPGRYARVRVEVEAKRDELVRIVDYLKPGLEEFCALLPSGLARRLLAWEARRGRPLRFDLKLDTTSLMGHGLLRLLAVLKPLRRFGSRHAEEQGLIERWLESVRKLAAWPERAPANELVQCARLLRGYGETQRRCRDAFTAILDAAETADTTAAATLATLIRDARLTALGEPEARPAQEKKVVWIKAALAAAPSAAPRVAAKV